uniref:transmembrane protein 202-like n=1 Tax=Ictidomys tridecemlineatus TaxID=43179 RepID=UPI001A9F9B02|nr:transmembrane protein 202-like [Ictidomys tridecemlineatus]
MERKEENGMMFHSPYKVSILNNITYRPILPCRIHCFYGLPLYQQQFLEKTRSYIHMLCASLLSFIFVLLLCLSTLHWVQFIVLADREKLFAGLWTACHHNLCWSHMPKAPYYLQFSRAFFLISVFITLIIIICLIISSTKRPEQKTYIDLGVSIFCFISGTCLLLCLILFLMQVELYSRNVLEPHFLFVYRFNWWGIVFYIVAGFFSGLNHIIFRIALSKQNLVTPITKTRIRHMATLRLNLTKTNVNAFPQMHQISEMPSQTVVQPRSQSDIGIQIDLETGNESIIRNGLMTRARLATETEPAGIIEPGAEAETMIGM